LDEVDLVYLHVESPDESGHAGLLDAKVTAISDFDKKVVGPVLEEAKRRGDTRVIALSDHATPLEIKTHSLELVPFAIYPPTNGNGAESFDERIVDESDLVFDSAISLNDHFLKFGATEK
jgi:2,3-bisphosphoglycerate-independent phosphoglycerate mutase